MIVDITGHWTGFYTYAKGYSELNKLISVPFNVTIKVGINEFIGRLTEEVEFGGIEDEIVIHGKVTDGHIEFTKYYTREHIILDTNDSFSFASNNPNVVYYKGKFDEDENRFKGQWELAGLREDDNGVFHAENQSGEWEMWRW